MNKQQAQQIIRDTFESAFDKSVFTIFIKNLLNRIDESKAFHARGDVKEMFRNVIRTYERIGTFETPDNEKIDIIVVYLQKGYSLDHARVTQRNFAGRYLVGRGEKNAGLFAFVSPDEEDWRFSLVKMDYKFEKTKTGGMKVKEEFTPARRWSFLVGENEGSHTAQSCLVKILADDEKAPTLEEIEKAFDIETVTKEFFLKYRDLFLRTKEELDRVVKKDPKIKADFENKGVDTVNFSKKLLGQIVFLYFLQKKGWFGVGRDNDWGTGSKHFLRELFEGRHGPYKNFFNDILEPLFYEALRTGEDRKHEDYYYSRFDCKIPFLNGGLFDPIGNYDWVHTDIIIPNKLFSNTRKTKEGDTGDGILDIFDRYNFTVKEDEPLEKEVAIDPELLGKAYEKFNAIRPDNFDEFKKALKSGKKGEENKFNKKFGVYYTPREIVHYMCQQSLINYLDVELNKGATAYQKIGDSQTDAFGNKAKVGQLDLAEEHKATPQIVKDDIETLIHTGEQVSENEVSALIKEQNIKEGKQKTSGYKLQLPESIRHNAALIDQKLSDITVCDPAVGSGAFPVGMMSEIVRARNVLSVFLNDNRRTAYEFKRRCIEHSLYGVDIDPGAVEIAKLRLWLSLVVDEEDIKNIKPLPNLDYKIVRGNSLIGFPENWESPISKEIEDLKNEFFSETNPSKKTKLKKHIDDKLNYRYENSLKTLGYEIDFDFKMVFSEVFHEKASPERSRRGGFDVVIANPPYLRIQEIQKNDPPLATRLKKSFLSASGSFDIYACFVELAIRLICDKGNLAYILPHKFFQATFGKNLRQLISSKKMLKQIVDFGSSQVFESATTYTCLLFLSHRNDNFKFAELKPNTIVSDLPEVFELINGNEKTETEKVAIAIISNKSVSEKEWHFSAGHADKILTKLRMQPRTLADVCEKIFVGLQTSADKIFFLEHIAEKDGIVTAYSKSLKKEIIIEQGFVKPLLKGADVHRYLTLTPNIWNIFPYKIEKGKATLYSQNEIKKCFPMAWKYLLDNRKELENREHGRMKHDQFYAYIYPKNLTEFEREKIVTPDIASGCQMSLDDKGMYHTTTIYSFAFKKDSNESIKYYLSLLNSKILWYFVTSTGSILRGNYFRFKTNYLIPFPIPSELSQAEQQPFITLVNRILTITEDEDYPKNPQKQANVSALEAEIDQLVYKLYDLTPEEIKIVEGENG